MPKVPLGSVSFLIGAAIFGFVIYAVGIGNIVKSFLQFSPLGIAPLIGFTVFAHVISAVKWQYILRVMGFRVPLIPLFKMYIAGYAVSFITPFAYVGGEFFRGGMLRDKFDVPWTKSLSSIGIDKIVEGVVLIFTVFIGVAFFAIAGGIPLSSKIMTATLSAMSLFFVFMVLAFIFVFWKKSLVRFVLKPLRLENSSAGKFFAEMEKDFFVFFSGSRRKHLMAILQLCILKYGILLLRNVFLILYLTKTFSLVASVTALGFTYLSYVMPVPAGLGIQEGFLSVVFPAIGFDSGVGTVVSLLLRGVEVVMVAVGLFYLARWGLGKVSFQAVKWAKESFLKSNK